MPLKKHPAGTTGRMSAFRLTEADDALLDAIQAKLGIVNRTDAIRIAIRRLAELEKVKVASAKKRPTR